MLIILAFGSLGGPARAAATGSAWITITNAKPGVGCTVTVSVEVRANGDPVVGLGVEIAVSDNGNNLIAKDVETTDANGVAWLTFDTTGFTVGESDWMDVDLDGAYATGTAIVPSSGDCSDSPKEFSTNKISASDLATSSTSDSSSSNLGSFPTHHQDHTLSCEYASIQIATEAYGNAIPESVSLSEVPSAVDPHYGFRGNIDGPFDSTDDYGVYAEALIPVLNDNGYSGTINYGADASTLKAELDAGQPTLVWLSPTGDAGFYDQNAYGDRFLLVPGEHVVVAYAYDATGIDVSDPGNGQLEHFTWDWFLNSWSLMDGMSLSVSPS